jgi:ribosomal protein L3 glutamine methyltransferase
MPAELQTLIDLIRFGGSRFNAAGLCFGHSYDNALDEATQLVLHALHLPHDLNPVYGQSRVTAEEKAEILALFERRIEERIPAAYLTGVAWFAGLRFKSDRRALVPRSPIAELIETGFEPWLGIEVERALDLCTGSGCIAIAMAHHAPDWQVDAVDLSSEALALAAENVTELEVGDRVELLQGDLFGPVAGRRYQLIVSNPPYVTRDEVAALPQEYRFEPELGLIAGDDGLDLALRILRDAPDHLEPHGLLVVEVGESERALSRLLPEVPFDWIEFKVGQMGVLAITREALADHLPRITELAAARPR